MPADLVHFRQIRVSTVRCSAVYQNVQCVPIKASAFDGGAVAVPAHAAPPLTQPPFRHGWSVMPALPKFPQLLRADGIFAWPRGFLNRILPRCLRPAGPGFLHVADVFVPMRNTPIPTAYRTDACWLFDLGRPRGGTGFGCARSRRNRFRWKSVRPGSDSDQTCGIPERQAAIPWTTNMDADWAICVSGNPPVQELPAPFHLGRFLLRQRRAHVSAILAATAITAARPLKRMSR